MKTRLLACLLALPCIIASCSHSARRNSLPEEYEVAERLVSSRPDSSLKILEKCDTVQCGAYELATWRLLRTWADYNSYAPTISETRLNDAARFFLRGRDRQRKALCHYLIAVVGENNGTLGRSTVTDELKRGCREIEGCGDHNLASLLYMRYGVEMNDRKWHDSAIEAYEKAYLEAVEGGLTVTQVTTLINLSHSWLFKGDAGHNYDKAIDYALRAVDTAERAGLDDSFSRAMSALSSCYSRSGDYVNALDCARKATEKAEELYRCGKRKERVRHVALADAYRKAGNADSALFYATLDTAAIMNPVTRAGATQLMYIVYRDLLHNSDSAMKYMSVYNRQKEEISKSLENDKVLKNEVELEQSESREHLKKVTAVTVSAIIALLVALLSVFAVMRRRIGRKDRDLDDKDVQIRRQSREIERKSAEILEKKEMLGEVLIEKNALISGLREKPRYLTEAEGLEIVRTVDRACEGYCSGLAAKHPELTEANLRLLALVRLGFSTGEIAVMEGISPQSVTKAKQRLRSKVGTE